MRVAIVSGSPTHIILESVEREDFKISYEKGRKFEPMVLENVRV